MSRPGYSRAKKLPAIINHRDQVSSSRGQNLLLSLCLSEHEHLHEKLLGNGAILFRGFPTLSIPEFADFAAAFSGRQLLDYTAGASPRTKLGGGVYTSTEYPRNFTLSLHNELSYTFAWPEYLFFYCVTPAQHGGETPLGDSRSILGKIDPDVVDRFKRKGIRYNRVLEDQLASEYSWQAAFETGDRSAVEQYCADGGVSFRWNEDGSLFLSEVRPATAIHPKTNDEVWFNQADGFHPSVFGPDEYQKIMSLGGDHKLRLNCCFGDGSPIDISDLENIREVIRNEMVPVTWQVGDVLVVDNMLACHGRMPYSGPRKILLAMA